MTKLIILLGPTSTGKTSLAINLCKKHNGVMLSSDSRQIYKHMDVGTGKIPINKGLAITKSDQKWVVDGIDIWGYDLTDPNSRFSAYDYGQFSINKLNEIKESRKYKFIIMVGGTGFYIDVVTGKIVLSNISPNYKLRESLELKSPEELLEILTSLNKHMADEIDTKNKIRIIRAIEKERGKNENNALPRMEFTEFKLLGLTASRPLLYQRADEWVDAVWKSLVKETRWLLEGKYKNSDKLNAIVYKTAVSFIEGELGEQDAIQKTKFDMHAYIRRQQTYFKKNDKIKWFDITDQDTTKNIENLLQ
jgi:tRNA dimethylallyltransferase